MNDDIQLLLGHTFLIGREPGQGRLLISINLKGQPRTAALGNPGSVPASVSRLRAAEGVAHASLSVGPDGKLTLANLKSEGLTCVDGTAIASLTVKGTEAVTLGADRYAISLPTLLHAAAAIVKQVAPPPLPTVDIKPLEKVWADYQAQMDAIQTNQQRLAKRRMVPTIFTIGAGALSGLASQMGWPGAVFKFTVFLTLVGVVFLVVSFATKDKSYEQRKKAGERLMDDYVSPCCHHYLGSQPYRLVRQNAGKKCPYCQKAMWEEKDGQ